MRLKKAEKARKEFDNEFHEGFKLKDLQKNDWILGKMIGRGGFGNVYHAIPLDPVKVPDIKIDQFSAKIEPLSNGPLFTEIAFYQRVATKQKISAWVSRRSLKFLGIPQYLTSGCDKSSNQPHRFIVLPRLGNNVENIWHEMNNNFKPATCYQIGCCLLECLEYIHEFGYSHGDVKTSNLMTGYNDELTFSRVYLMDFGLATLFKADSNHKIYKEDPKRKHDGTVEYASLDAHKGAIVSRRGDLINLGFVILHLLARDLPWTKLLNDKEKVSLEKDLFLKNPIEYISKFEFLNCDYMDGMWKFFEEVNCIEYTSKPDYKRLFNLLEKSHNQYANDQEKRAFMSNRVCFSSSTPPSPTKISIRKRSFEHKANESPRYPKRNNR